MSSLLSNYDDSFCSKPCKEVVEPVEFVEPRFRAPILYFYSICQIVSQAPACWQLIERSNQRYLGTVLWPLVLEHFYLDAAWPSFS